MSATVLSPHYDDAILSCWHVLAGPGDVDVINVFTAPPPPGTPPSSWDLLTGTKDPAEQMRRRAAEDRAALAQLGRSAVALGFLDAQYREPENLPSPVRIAGRIAAAVGEPSPLLAPAAIGGHTDHVLVRDAALVLATQGWPVSLYADLPHAIAHGWPDWVGGARDVRGAGALWAAWLRSAGALAERLVAHIRPLGPRARERKLAALNAYASQRRALDHCGFAPLSDPRTLAWEVTWA